MTQKSRRQHSAQFKLDTAALVLDRGYTYAKAAETMGVDVGSIRGKRTPTLATGLIIASRYWRASTNSAPTQ